ncbi:MAG: tetratricopeptide repeat protein [Phycisphaerae bacterium]|nr:tetratricopeptide repeat protein [Phycisphaerae bacterium]
MRESDRRIFFTVSMAELSVDQIFEEAARHFFGGKPDEAEPALSRVVAQRPEHAEAIHMQGLIAVGRKDYAGGIDFFRKAIQSRPEWALAHFNLGNALMLTGQRDVAIDSYRRSIALGIQLRDAFTNLAPLLLARGEVEQAAAVFKQATDRFPNDAHFWLDLSGMLIRCGKYPDALAAAQRAVDLAPQQSAAYCNLGTALGKLGHFAGAIAALKQALALGPELAEVHFDLARAYDTSGDAAAAEFHHRRAVEIKPALALGWNGLGVNLVTRGRYDEAIACYERAVSLDPQYADAHTNLGIELLSRGQYERGFKEFEWRDRGTLRTMIRSVQGAARWDGSPLAGRTLLVLAEQGLGDTVHFLRYLAPLSGQDGSVIVECQAELHRLVGDFVRRTDPSIRVIPRGATPPPFDVQCPMMSLPVLLGCSDATPPVTFPYLNPSAEEIEFWKSRLNALPAGPKVGLAWSGNPGHPCNATRSISFSELLPLFAHPEVHWISLQTGSAAWQSLSMKPPANFTDWAAEFHNFNDAALMVNLDLIISIDTSVAHVAGALGRPTWLLLSKAADWRWLRERGDTPWYPTMRLFRQTTLGDWPGVVRSVDAALAELK